MTTRVPSPADQTTCATCAHWDLSVFPPAALPVAQCWAPNFATVGVWFRLQVDRGAGTLVWDCPDHVKVELQKGL